MATFKTNKRNYSVALGKYFCDFGEGGVFRTNDKSKAAALRRYPTFCRDFVEIDEKNGKIIGKRVYFKKKSTDE